MCGIVGILSAYSNGFSCQESDAFQNMLAVDGLRGDDSTGVFAVEHNGNVHIAKEASNAYTFLAKKEAKDVMHEILMRGAIAVGHNRAATRGAIVDSNAHPFWVNDEIVLVQNGTWLGDHKHVKNTDVDTECVAQIIAEEKDIKQALKRINAAYALVWYNVTKKELYLLRNKERPLYIAGTTDNGMVFASEAEIILFGASRAGLKLKEKPYLLADDTLVTIGFSEGEWELTNTKVSTKYNPPKSEIKQQNFPMVIPTTTHIGGAVARAFPTTNQPRVVTARGVDNLQIHNYIHRAAFADWHIRDEALARKHQSDYATKKDQIYIELIDYVPAEEGKACKAWHLIFAEIHSSKEDPGPMLYHTVRNIDEKVILTMIEQPFRIANEHGSPIIHVITHSNGEKEFVTAVRITGFEKETEEELAIAKISEIAGKTVH